MSELSRAFDGLQLLLGLTLHIGTFNVTIKSLLVAFCLASLCVSVVGYILGD